MIDLRSGKNAQEKEGAVSAQASPRTGPLPQSPDFYSFSGGMIELVCSDEDCVSVGATQSPAHSFVPRTVPTSLQPVGAFGLT
jgi:hypothetical protein